jgi:trans-aconitate methyltransferase
MDLRERTQHAFRHPWETVRADFFQRLVRVHAPRASTVIDVGAGDSWFATELHRTTLPTSSISCWDISYNEHDLADWQHSHVSRSTEQPGHRADLVLALDVVEHVEHDAEFVQQVLAELVEPSGVLIVSVPAHQQLFTRHDTALGHYRRYSQRQLRAVLETRFHVVASGSLFTSLLAPRLVSALIARYRTTPAEVAAPESEWHHGRVITSMVVLALQIDRALLGGAQRLGLRIPGLSVWAVCVPRNETRP